MQGREGGGYIQTLQRRGTDARDRGQDLKLTTLHWGNGELSAMSSEMPSNYWLRVTLPRGSHDLCMVIKYTGACFVNKLKRQVSSGNRIGCLTLDHQKLFITLSCDLAKRHTIQTVLAWDVRKEFQSTIFFRPKLVQICSGEGPTSLCYCQEYKQTPN